MRDEVVAQARAALVALAGLSPANESKTAGATIPLDWFRWLDLGGVAGVLHQPASHTYVKGDPFALLDGNPTARPALPHIERDFGDHLAAIDRLRPGRRSLRVGWLFVAGTTTGDEGRGKKVFWPLVTRPVRVVRGSLGAPSSLISAGDLELTWMIRDRERHAELEAQISTHGDGGGAFSATGVAVAPELLRRLTHLRRFAEEVAAAAGLTATELIPAGEGPDDLMKHAGLRIVAGVAVYSNTETGGLSRSASLEAWARRELSAPTAFHSLYVGPDGRDAGVRDDSTPAAGAEPPFLLTPVQREAVGRTRHDPLTVIRGAPGTGKSHTIAAIACDALARGETVLVTAKAEATVDALLDLFERAPGPRPVVFGSNERKDALAAHLANGLATAAQSECDHAAERLRAAVDDRDAAWTAIAARVRGEDLWDEPAALDAVRATFPGLFAAVADLADLLDRANAAAATTGGWWARRRRRRMATKLIDAVGCPPPTTLSELADAITTARSRREWMLASGRSAPELDAEWEALRKADDLAHERAAQWLALDCRSPSRLHRDSRVAVAALATALRSGRAARREQLARLDSALTDALPLWAGTLTDIEDLLPSRPGLFDLVILDEASSIDQPTAALALLRGKRAVIVGDPQQLRHVSFIGDEQRDRAIVDAGIDPTSSLAAQLDVRRNSIFDVASGVAPVLTLDEHFRCRPHLVQFVAHRLYAGAVHVATRSPATHDIDCVDVVCIDGTRDEQGVVRHEVEVVMRELRRLRSHGITSVGVVTPFRAQAEAIEVAVLKRFTLDDIEALDLRVGTVHAFQGNERDVVIASLGIGAGADPRTWRFVEDEHLFTVLVTRARERFVIVHAGELPEDGLVADYLAQADAPPGSPPDGAPPDEWTAAIARGLTDAGVPRVTSYPSGRHHVDICVGDELGFYALECGVHPDGADAHIERHLALRRRGWPVREALPSRWADQLGELVVELAAGPAWPAARMPSASTGPNNDGSGSFR